MKISQFLLGTSLLAGLVLVGRSVFSKPGLTPTELLKEVDIRSLAVMKSTGLALEKSDSSLLRAIVQQVSDDLRNEHEQLRKISYTEYFGNPLLVEKDLEPFLVSYDYNEDSPFDLAYARHQINECDEIITMLRAVAHRDGNSTKDNALRTLIIFLRYHTDLTTFLENFLTINEYRVRELAYQIWESEDRPEGQAKRHWAMAEELAKNLSSADWQLAIEQKRSAVETFSTSPEPKTPAVNNKSDAL